MAVRVIAPPQPFLPLGRVKSHLKVEVEDTEFDALITGYLGAAVAWLDGPAGWLGRSLGAQVLELVGDGFPSCPLPMGPIIAVESIVYVDASGAPQTMPEGDYRLLTDGRLYADAWPTLGAGPEAVRIRYRAGYPDRVIPPSEPGGETQTVSTVPEPVCQAILLLVGQWFRTRENVVTGTIATALPFAVEALLAPYRVWR